MADRILVIGSLNMDCRVETEHLPKSGETVSGSNVVLTPGGKGANQAYAIGKLGGNVGMIGAVGADANGKALLANLESIGVDTRGIRVAKDVPTGEAFITVDEEGENSIIIIAGANELVDKKMIDDNIRCIEESDIIVMQLEIPPDTVTYAKNKALGMGKTVIIDPAPAGAGLTDALWTGVDFIKPNETELAALTGRTLSTYDDLRESAVYMISKGVKNVLVSLGSKGCLWVSEDEEKFFKAQKVKAVDTTAAGDSFVAAFALALSKHARIDEAICFGQKVSAIAVTRKGAQASVPTFEEVVGIEEKEA